MNNNSTNSNLTFKLCPTQESYDPTIEDAYMKDIELDGKQVSLEIFDTAGQASFSYF